MQTAKEISVFLDNKPSRLASVVSALATRRINITAVTVTDSNRGVLRIITDNPAQTRAALKELNFPFEEEEVVLVEMRNQPGALAQVCETLAYEHINIDHAYCSAGSKNGKTVGIFKVSNMPKMLQVLAESPGSRARRGLVRRSIGALPAGRGTRS